MEKQVAIIKQNLTTTQDIQKSYVNKYRMHREFQVGEKVFLKFKGIKSSLRLGNCKKLAARFHGPFEVLSRNGSVAYGLALPPSSPQFFYISLLNKYVYNSEHVLDWFAIQVEPGGDFLA